MLTQIDLDDDALRAVMRLTGVRTKKEAVNLSLREFAAYHERKEQLEHYAELAGGWDEATGRAQLDESKELPWQSTS